jgi:thiamine-monophosphate kinase
MDAPVEDPQRPVADLTERALIARIRDRLRAAPPWVIIGIGDDAAVVEPARNALEVITTDVCVDGVHVDSRFMPPAAIGARALAMNLSDLAAMGAAPRLATLSLLLPEALAVADLDALIEGVGRHGHRARRDRRRRQPVAVTRPARTRRDGARHRGTPPRARAIGARPGDHVYVSGTVGAARAGLQQLQAGASPDGNRPRRAATCGRNPACGWVCCLAGLVRRARAWT